jgi:hypothetical protein
MSEILLSMFLNFMYSCLTWLDFLGQILDRGEKIELLVGKTETLQSQVCMAFNVFGNLCEKIGLYLCEDELMLNGECAVIFAPG